MDELTKQGLLFSAIAKDRTIFREPETKEEYKKYGWELDEEGNILKKGKLIEEIEVEDEVLRETFDSMGEEEKKKAKQDSEEKKEALKLSIKAGLNTGKLYMQDFAPSFTEIATTTLGLGSPIGADAAGKTVKKILEKRKVNTIETIKSIRNERDSIYLDNPDTFGLATKFLNGVVENISNPINLVLSATVGVVTGGASLPVQIGAQALADTGQLVYETSAIEERMPSLGELAINATVSSVADVAGAAISRSFSKGISNTVNVKGDLEVNVRSQVEAFGDTDLNVGDTKRMMFIENPKARTTFDTDPVNINEVKANDFFQYDTVLQRDYNNFVNKFKDPNTDFTVRHKSKTDFIPDEVTAYKIFNDGRGKTLGKESINRRDVQGEFLKNIEQYVKRATEGLKKQVSGGKKEPVVKLDTIGVDRAIKSMNNQFRAQQINVYNEYSALNNGLKNIDYLKTLSKQDRNLTKNWVTGTFEQYGNKKFLDNLSQDRVIIEDMRIFNDRYAKDDLIEFEGLVNRNRTIFDEYDELVVNDEVFKKFEIGFKENDNKAIVKSGNFQEFYQHINNKIEPELKDILFKNTKYGKAKVKEGFAKEFDELTLGEKNFIKQYGDKIIRFEEEVNTAKYHRNIRMQQAIDKQALFRKYREELYDQSVTPDLEFVYKKYGFDIDELNTLDSIIETDIKLAENIISPEKMDKLYEEIAPYFGNYFERLPDTAFQNIEQRKKFETTQFYKFLSNVADTRNSQRGTGHYKTFADIEDLFLNEDKFYDFFMNLNEDLVKSDRDMLREVLDRNVNDISRLMSYGSVSPWAVKNRLLNNMTRTFRSKTATESESTFLNATIASVRKRLDVMLENTQVPEYAKKTSQIERVADKTLRGMRASIWFSGLEEFGLQNNFVATLKASKYDSTIIAKAPWYNSARMLKRSKILNDEPSGFHSIANSFYDMDYNRLSKTGLWNRMERTGIYFQRASDRQQKNYAQSHATYILDSLPEKYTRLNNDMKALLKNSNVTEANYTQYRNSIKNHINSNGLTVNVDQLNRAIEVEELTTDFAPSRQLLQSFYDLWDDLTIDSNSVMKKRMDDTLSKFFGLYRGFARTMNKDLLDRVLYSVDADGYTSSRIMSFARNPSDALKETPALLFKASTLPILGTISGLGYTTLKELQRGNRDFSERLAVVSNNFDNIYQDMVEIGEAKTLKEKAELTAMLLYFNDFTELSPERMVEILEPTDMFGKYIKSIEKIYKTSKDDIKKVQGVSDDEIKEELAKMFVGIFPYTLSRNIDAFLTTPEARVKKVFGKDSSDMLQIQAEAQRFRRIIRGEEKEKRKIDKNTEKKKTKKLVEDLQQHTEYVDDYFNDKTGSYEKLTAGKKDLFEKAFTYTQTHAEGKNARKAEYAMLARSAEKKDIPELLRTVFGIEDSEEFAEYYETQKKGGFKKLSDGKQNLFKALVDEGVLKDTAIEKEKYVKMFADVKDKEQIIEKLTQDYNVTSYNKLKKIIERKNNYDSRK